MSVLTVENVSMIFGGLVAVDQVSIELQANELVGLIGPNGAGKTTLFNMLTGVYIPSNGNIYVDVFQNRKNLTKLKPYQISQVGIARTFQNIRLYKKMSVLENVLVAMHQNSQCSMLVSVLRLPKYYKTEAKMRKEALALLTIFGLEDKWHFLADKLSYGEQRCLEIVRALATKPSILFLDEPAAGMNPQETENLAQLIRKIQQEFDLTILLIEHDMSLVMSLCQRIYVLEYGRLIASGTPKEIQTNPKVIKAYLGEEL